MEVNKDYYAVLNASPKATDEEIRVAYRKLAREFHPDVNPDAGADEKFKDLQEAYEVLGDPKQRKKYDHWRKQQGLDRSSALSLHAIPSHDSLVSLPNEQAYYVLLSTMPATNLPAARLPLNLCLVLDKSTSMQGSRLQQVKEAINRIIDKLRPEDALSLVVFSDRAKVLLPSQRHIDAPRAKSLVSTIQASGGTEILQGLLPGLEELKRHQSEKTVNHLILLTDGQTYGDAEGCLEQARWAGNNQIQLSTIGIGTDWNEDLLDQMADLSNGTSIYIDSPEKIQNIFSETLHNLETVIARELTMKVNTGENVRLHSVNQITPHICQLEAEDDEEGIKLGALSLNQEKSALMEFRIKTLHPGEHRLMRIMVEGDMPGQPNRSWEWIEITAQVKDEPDPHMQIPSQVMAALNKLSIYRMQKKVASDLAAGHVQQATQRLELIATRLLDLGEVELSRAALLEAGQIKRTSTLSAEGSKKIRYGTRALLSKETSVFGTQLIA